VGSKKATKVNKAEHNTPNSEPLTPNVVHIPVLLREAIDLLAPKAGGVYVDGTLGAGGHATEILKRSEPDGILIGLDQDAEAVERSRTTLAPFGGRAAVRQANYRDLPEVLSGLGYGPVDGVLLDLGVSWFHLKSPVRGFSFMLDGPLDMRMDQSKPLSAADLVNTFPREELARILREYGEESRAWAIAGAIEKARVREPITSTAQLARIVTSVFPPYPPRRIHPATLTFQALRIAVNDEMDSLREGLDRIIPLVKDGGRLAVISFHSLEDRIVKRAFAVLAKGCVCPPKMPVCSCGRKPELKVLTPRPIIAGPEELERNPAARSAKLRAAEKLPQS
jgi:16S rRNA (cytosine1402-N4)-methyltransferase